MTPPGTRLAAALARHRAWIVIDAQLCKSSCFGCQRALNPFSRHDVGARLILLSTAAPSYSAPIAEARTASSGYNRPAKNVGANGPA